MAIRLPRFGVLAVAAAVATGAACSSSNHRAPTRTASAARVTITAAPATTQPLRSRLVATISIDNPDGLVEVGGAIWVKTDDGRVVRIDPRTNKVTGTIRVDTAKDRSHYCQGIGTDGTAVWACTASDSTARIVRIDPRSLTKGKVVGVNKVFDQLTLPHTSRGIWVLTGTGNAVTVVDPSSGAMTSYPLGARCQQLAASEAIVVATCANDNTLVALQQNTGSIRGHLHLAEPRIAAITDHDIWVDTAKGLIRLDTNLTARALYPNQIIGLDGDLATTDDALWVRTPGCVLWRIDQSRNTLTEQLTTNPAISGGSLLVTADSLWASANNEGIIYRLRR